MKKLLILSGKGGTGKTTVAAAFVSLAKARAFADCDVDAPNLHLVMHDLPAPTVSDYHGMGKAFVDENKCISCGICISHCRFDAIDKVDNGAARINPFACEGCGLCEALCPTKAIAMVEDKAGDLMLYRIFEPAVMIDDKTASFTQAETAGYVPAVEAVFSTAELKMGSGTSGKLVSEVKKQLAMAAPKDAQMAVIDGSPGIGCPVIASITGVNFVLIVAEPSVSGISDMKRIIETAMFFGVDIAVCTNKADTNWERTTEIERFCQEHALPFVGRIPYDSKVIEATNAGRSIDSTEGPASDAVREVFRKVTDLLQKRSIEI